MSKLRDDLIAEREAHKIPGVDPSKDVTEDEVMSEEEAVETTEAEAADASLEVLTLSMQIDASQARLEQILDERELSPGYSGINGCFYVSTPYGDVRSAFCFEGDNEVEEVLDSIPESDKVGRRFLKKNGIKTDDRSLSGHITDYFFYQSVTGYIESVRDELKPEEYERYHGEARAEQLRVMQVLNQKGFAVNPRTGELEYQNPTLQRAIAQARANTH